jgi:hypothetical protein
LRRVAPTGFLPSRRITLQGCIIERFDAPSSRGGRLLRPVCATRIPSLNRPTPGFQPPGLLSSARRTFTVQETRPDGGEVMISTEDRPLRNFLRTKPLLWVEKGAPFCLRGTYNGAQFHGQRGNVAVGPTADGAPSRA